MADNALGDIECMSIAELLSGQLSGRYMVRSLPGGHEALQEAHSQVLYTRKASFFYPC